MKVKLPQFSKALNDKLQKIVDEIVSDEYLQKIGDELVEQIKLRTKLGKGVFEHLGDEIKLKALSEPYVEKRKVLKKEGKLHDTTTPGRSNLTLTGAMLNDLFASVKDGRILISFKDEFSSDKAKWNAEMGREFLNISKAQALRLRNKLQAEIIKKL